MRKTLLKDTLREIRKTFSRFLAILAIVALGTAFFVGIKTTCPDMKISADQYFKDTRFMDFRLASTGGLTTTDITAIKALDGVKGVMPSYSLDAVMTAGKREKVLHIISLPAANSNPGDEDFINRPQVIEGRLPEQSGECVIERNNLTGVASKIGDKIQLSSGDGSNLLDQLATDEYTVVGIIRSPLYISKERGSTSIGSGRVSAFMQIPGTDFKQDYYSSVYVTAEIDNSLLAYSTGYDQAIAPLKSALEALGTERADLRDLQIRTDAQKALDEQWLVYNNSVSQARAELAAAEVKITEGQQQIGQGKQQLAQARVQLTESSSAAQSQITQGQNALAVARDDYQSKLDAFTSQKAQAIAAGIYEAQQAAFAATEAELAATKLQLDNSASDLAVKQQQLDLSQATGEQQLSAQAAGLTTSQEQLDQSKLEFTQGKAETEQKLANAKQQLAAAQTEIAAIPTVKWYVLGRDTNSGYVEYGGAADRMDAIAQVFPVIFSLVAVLICFTSMIRMVEEQRSYMGTVKALGYAKATIAGKFLAYAISASIIGGLLGLAVGFTVFPSGLFKAYSILYTMPKFILVFDVPFAIIALTVGLLVTSLSALLVCFSELNHDAATLMRPKAPKAGQVILLERIKFIWNRMKFTQKVTARNLFRYKSRFFMTVIGVGGCTALLLVGFGLNDAIKTIGHKQFGEIDTYQMSISLKDKISGNDSTTIAASLREQPDFLAAQNIMVKGVDVGLAGIEKGCSLVVPEDAANINQFIVLRDRTTHVAVPLTESGVVLTEKLAKMLGANVGDEIYLKQGDTGQLKVQVTGICETYLQHFLFMSPSLYQQLYGTSPKYNQINVKLNTTAAGTQESLAKQLVSLPGVSSVNLKSDSLAQFDEMIKTIYSVILILIVSAGLLSFIVLYTLTNINVTERMREIATIKVLGFYDREVASYVFRENLILTMLGAGLGLLIGGPLARYVIGSAEVEMVMFGRQIYLPSFLYATILTLGFSMLVNIVMLRTLKDIDMVESLKTVE